MGYQRSADEKDEEGIVFKGLFGGGFGGLLVKETGNNINDYFKRIVENKVLVEFFWYHKRNSSGVILFESIINPESG